MINYELDIDEGILLQSTELERIGKEELSLDEMVLTNKNIICVYEKSNGLFKKSDTIVEKLPLSTIKVVNGKVQASLYDDDEYGKGLQIWFKDGHREHILFSSSPKKEIPFWVDAISEAITGEPAVKEAPKKKAGILGGLSAVLSGEMDMRAVAEKVSSKLNDISEKCYEVSDKLAGKSQSDCNGTETETEPDKDYETIETVSVAEVDAVSQVEDKPNEKYIYCSNCGEKLIATAKFCQGCGVKVGTVIVEQKVAEKEVIEDNSTEAPNEKTESIVTDEPVATPTQEEYNERKTVYEGIIHKCPNCGDIIDAYETVCESCGYEIRERTATSSVRELAAKLEGIESQRESIKSNPFKDMYFGRGLTRTDEQKISLIKSFPIPNTKEDLYEFLILSSSNIDFEAYDESNQFKKNSARAVVSNAWKSKFEQAYQKAKIVFQNDSRMLAIKELYENTYKSINKARWKNHKMAGIMIAITFGSFAIMGLLVFLLESSTSKSELKQVERLESIVVEIETALDDGDYKLALMNADRLDFTGSDTELNRDWEIKREYWIDKVIEEAAEDGVILEKPIDKSAENETSSKEDNTNTEDIEESFTNGFNDAMEESKKEIQENIDAFYENLNGDDKSSMSSEQ